MTWLNGGLLPSKMVVGIPTYGRGYTMPDTHANEFRIYCPADGPNPMGPYTRQDGHYGYNEVIQAQNNGTLIGFPGATAQQWQIYRDDCYKAPHMVNDVYWISYDDPQSVAEKVEFIKFINAAGAMVWSVETDDFLNGYPLMNSINNAFVAGGPGVDPSGACSPMPACDDSGTPYVECTRDQQLIPYPGNCNLYIRCNWSDEFSRYILECNVCEASNEIFSEASQSCIVGTPFELICQDGKPKECPA